MNNLSIPIDTDGDGITDNSDNDDDNDGFSDFDEQQCLSDPLENNSIPLNFDADSRCDALDEDDDNDGVADIFDDFPFDGLEFRDTDGDGEGDNSDFDDDNDGWSDYAEQQCLTISTDASSVPDDSDGDGICDLNEDDDSGLLPGFGLLTAISMLSLAAFTRRD